MDRNIGKDNMPLKSNGRYWESRSKIKNSIKQYRRKFWVERVIKLFNSWFHSFNGSWILDAGCGWGYWLALLGKRSTNIVGLDLSLEMLKSARILLKNNLKNITLIRGDIMNMPFPVQTFDLVISLGVVEHFSDTLSALKNTLNVLKRKKFLFLSVPNAFGFPNRISRFIIKSKTRKTYHQKYFTSRKIVKMLKKVNSRSCAINGYGDIIPPIILRRLFKSLGILRAIKELHARLINLHHRVVLKEIPLINSILSHMILIKCTRL